MKIDNKVTERLNDISDTVLNDIAKNVMVNAGKYDGKYKSVVSLSTHMLNVLTVGLNSYVFDTIHFQDQVPTKEQVAVLSSGLILHDVNKYLSQKTGEEYKNDRKGLKKYLENDDFSLSILFEDLDNNIEYYEDDILYLIQRTEKTQNASQTRGKIRDQFSDMAQYCEFADSTISSITVDGLEVGKEKIRDRYPELYQEININKVEYPFLNQLTINSIKKVINNNYGIVFGSSMDTIIYLGSEFDYNNKDLVVDNLKNSLTKTFSFDSKTKWNTYEYQSISLLPLGKDNKRDIIRSNWVDVLEHDSGRDTGLDNISDGGRSILPELSKIIFRPSDSDTEIEKSTEKIFKDADLESLYQEAIDDAGSSHSEKIQLLHNTVREFENYSDELNNIAEQYREKINQDLSVDNPIIENIVYRILGIQRENKDININSTKMCFLCGDHADKEYKPGDNSIFSTRSYSRRTGPHQTDKYICKSCEIENAILNSYIENSPEYISRFDGSIIYVFSHNFVPDLKVEFDWRNDLIGGDVDPITDDPEDWNITQYGLINQFDMIPVSFDDESDRVNKIINILRVLSSTGLKASISRPFCQFEHSNEVFIDTDPIRIEKTLGIDKISDYKELRERNLLFDIIDSLDVKYDRRYSKIRYDEFVHIVSTFVKESDIPISNKSEEDLEKVERYVRVNHNNKYMKMKEIAQNGIDLYGKTYDSKHSKTNVFRECLEETIAGLNMELEREELVEYVSGQVYEISDRQDYSGNVKTEQAEKFVNSVIEYLEENNLLTLQSLSDKMNSLVNTYLFSYEKQLKEY